MSFYNPTVTVYVGLQKWEAEKLVAFLTVSAIIIDTVAKTTNFFGFATKRNMLALK